MATLITGASSGIGEEFAHHYAAEKHDLVLVARSEDKLNTLADTLRGQHGIQVTVIALDLSEPDAAQRLWEETNRAGLEINVLVNNAGFGTHGDVADDNPDRLEQEVRLNCLTLTGLTARYLPTMRERKTGTIINIASTAAFQPLPHMAVYGATKAFVLSFTEALWAETRKDGIRVLAVCPGPTDTSFFEIAGESAAVGKMRSTRQLLESTLQALKTTKPSFVDGLGNAVVARLVTRVVPKRAVMAIVDQAFQRQRSQHTR